MTFPSLPRTVREKLNGEGRPLSCTVPLKRVVSVFSRPLLFSEKEAVSNGVSDGKVIRFHRDNPESSVIGKTPSAKPASGKTDAGKLLNTGLAFADRRLTLLVVGSGGVHRQQSGGAGIADHVPPPDAGGVLAGVGESRRVSVDAADGSISGLDRVWTEDVTFDSPDGILDGDAAAGCFPGRSNRFPSARR